MATPAQAQGFGPVTVYSTSVNRGPFDVKLGDLNGDGLLDIVTAETESGIGVLLGLAGGAFAPVINYAVGPSTAADDGAADVVLGDVTGDGRLDIVATTRSNGGTVVVLPGLGNGGFGAYVAYSPGLGGGPHGLALGDLNSDGRLDIVVANNKSHTVGVLLAQAGGVFTTAVTYACVPGSQPEGVTLGDVNGDGRLDIVTTCNKSGVAIGPAVLLAQAGGVFGPPTAYNCATHPRKVALGDLNGDGRLDIVIDGVGSQVGVLLGLVSGGFGAATAYATGGGGLGLTLGDVNDDGLLDIIVANTGSATVGVLSGQIGGSFGTLATYSTVSSAPNTPGGADLPYAVALGDVNGDGHTDLVTANALNSRVGVMRAVTPPTLSAASPSAGAAGSTLTLTGTNLAETTLVSFVGSSSNTVSSGFIVNVAGTQITGVVVPSGASTGPITVRNLSGTATTVGSFTVQAVTSSMPSTVLLGLILIPNPAHGTVTVVLPSISGVATATLTILDALGRALYTQMAPTNSKAELDLTGLAPGLYAVRVQAGGRTATQRLVVE